MLWNRSMLAFAVACFAGVAIFELGKSRFAPARTPSARQVNPDPAQISA